MKVSEKKFSFFFFINLIIIFIIFITIFLFSKGSKIRDIIQSVEISLKEPYLIQNHKNYKYTNFHLIVKNLYQSLLKIPDKNKFDTMKIDISFKNYNKIISGKNSSLSKNFDVQYNENKESVNANISYKGKTYKAKVRLKGDRADHWIRNKKLSLNIDLKDGHTIMGMSSFSLLNHNSRQFPTNEILSRLASRMGLLTQHYENIIVNLNGDDWGLMYVEEEITIPFQELKRGLKGTPIARYSTKDNMRLVAVYGQNEKDVYDEINFFQKRKGVKIYNLKQFKGKLDNIVSLHKSINKYSYRLNDDIIYSDQFLKYFDIKKMARLFAIEMAHRFFHGSQEPNIKFYYNPFTSKLEPMPTDFDTCLYNFGNINECRYKNLKEVKEILGETYDAGASNLYIIFFKNKFFYEEYLKSLEVIKKDSDFIKKDLDNICKNFIKECRKNYSIDLLIDNINFLIKNKDEIQKLMLNKVDIDKLKFNNIKKYFYNKNINNQKYKNFILEHPEDYLDIRFFDNNIFELSSLTFLNVTIESLDIFYKNKDTLNAKQLSCKKNINLNFKLKYYEESILDLNKFDLNRSCLQYIEYIDVKYVIEKSPAKLKVENIESHKYQFENLIKKPSVKNYNLKLDNKTYYLDKGIYIVDKPIVIPEGYNFKIIPGTILKFEPESFIYIKSGNFISEGKENDKIYLLANNKYWKGIFVRNSKLSIIKNTKISDLNFYNDYENSISLTGGISFYYSTLNISDLVIDNVISEDAINLIHSKFDINKLYISNTKSDAVDSDFSEGTIKNSEFINIGGDAIDTSGTRAKLFNIQAKNIADKGLSIGEASNVFAENIRVSNSGIGVASKDGSFLKVNGAKFIKNKLDVAAYQKKNMYEMGGTLEIDNYKTDTDNLKINQDKESKVTLNKIIYDKINFKFDKP